MSANPRKVVVFSGGSAANSLVDVFNQVIEKNNCSLTYVIPISDNGGSSSELIRVFGGPSIGDVRSMELFSPHLDANWYCIVLFSLLENGVDLGGEIIHLGIVRLVQCGSAYMRFCRPSHTPDPSNSHPCP